MSNGQPTSETTAKHAAESLEDCESRARPRRLVTAARHCAQAMLRTGRGPSSTEEEACAAAEQAWESTRRHRPLAYSNHRHVEALARLLAAEARAAALPSQV